MLNQSHIRGLLQSLEMATQYTVPATLLDVSGNNYHGTNVGGVFASDNLNRFGNAVLIDGASEYINCGDVDFGSFYGASGYGSICISFKYMAETNQRVLVSRYGTTIQREFYCLIDGSNNLRLVIFSETNSSVYLNCSVSTSSLVSGTWYNLVYVYDNTLATADKIKCYLNNLRVGVTTAFGTFVGMTNTNVNLYIGNAVSGSDTNNYNSALCHFVAYNSILSESDIATLYSDFLAGNSPSIAASKIIHLPLNAANATAGTTLVDKSGNGNNATVVGGTWTADRFGRANRAILLDGVDDYIDCGLANYQGDLSGLLSMKVITLTDADNLFSKGFQSSAGFPPNIRQMIRTTNNALNTQTYYSSGNLSGPSNLSNRFVLEEWIFFYFAFKNGVGSTHGSGGIQNTLLNANVNTAWSNYKMYIGRNESTAYSNISTDRIMLFNRFLSGYELSKLANRLKIGDMDK
jgi:hypothetical protein